MTRDTPVSTSGRTSLANPESIPVVKKEAPAAGWPPPHRPPRRRHRTATPRDPVLPSHRRGPPRTTPPHHDPPWHRCGRRDRRVAVAGGRSLLAGRSAPSSPDPRRPPCTSFLLILGSYEVDLGRMLGRSPWIRQQRRPARPGRSSRRPPVA